MPNLLSGQVLRQNAPGQYISLPGAQPALGPSPSTSTGFTLITTPGGVTSYSNILGNITFAEGSMTNYVSGQDIRLDTTGGFFKVYAPTQFFSTVEFANTFSFVDLTASGHIRFTGGFTSTSVTSGTLVVTGGAGISGDVYIGKSFNTLGTVNLNPAGHNVNIAPTAGGTVVINPISAGSIDNVDIGLTTPGQGKFTTVVALTETLLSNTDSTSTTTGALIVNGGVGVGHSLYATKLFDNNKRVISEIDYGPGLVGNSFGPTITMTNTGVLSLTAGTGTYVSTTTGNVTVWTYGNTLQAVTQQGNTTNVAVYFNNLTNSTASNTGSVVIAGGLGVGLDLRVGGNIYAANLTPDRLYVDTIVANRAVFTTTVITSLAASTATISNNALYVTGGAGIQTDLTVGGNAFVYGNLTVLGTYTTVISNVADVGRKVVALSTSAGPAILSIDSGITVGPISSPFAKFLFDGINDWKSTGNIIPATDGGYSLGTPGYQWSTLYSQTANISSGVQATNTTTGALVVAGGIGVGGSMYAGGNVRFISKTASTGTTTGALVVSGGVGIQGALNVGGLARIQNTTPSTSTTTGALVVSGGVGVGGTVYANNFVLTNGDAFITTGSIYNYAVGSIHAGTDTAVSTSTGPYITVWNTSTLQSITDRGATTDHIVSITNTTNAINSTTGALIVAGGVGIVKDLYVGGNAIVYGNTTFNGTITNVLSTNTVYTDNIIELHKPSGDTWLTDDGKDIGIRMHYFGTADDSAFFGRTHDTGNLEWYGSGVETNGSTFTGIYGTFKTGLIRLVAGVNSTGINSGTLVVSGGAGISGNLYAGQVFSNGSQVVTQATLGTYGVSVITAGTDTAVSSSTGAVTVWNTSTFQTVTDRGNTTTNRIFIANTTTANTGSGALVVSGGISIGDSGYFGGSLHAADLYLSGTANVGNLTVANLNVTSGISATSVTASGPVSILTDINDTSTFLVRNVNSGTNASGGYAIQNDVGNRVELSLSSSNRVLDGFGTGTAYLYLSDGIDSFNIGDNAAIRFFTQGGNDLNVPTLSLGQDGLSTFVDSVKITDNRFDTSPKATLLLESNARAGHSTITLDNTSIDGQSWSLEVGGSNYGGQLGTAVNEGNFTLHDNIANEYRLVVAKTTGNVLLGFETDDGINRLQVNGSANISGTVNATTGSFVDLNITGSSTVDIDLHVLGNLTVDQALDVKSTATFESTVSVAQTATFSKTVIVGSSALETSVTTINTTDPTQISSFDAILYRSARCVVQVTDTDFFHLSEIVLLHDTYGQVHKSEYGIISTNGPLGDFTTELADGRVILYFTAYNATEKTINVVQTIIGV